MVHFVVEEDGQIRPLCGEWGDDRSWTRVRGAVTCPRCLALLGGGPGTRRAGGVPAADLLTQVFALHPPADA